ncbi:MAG: PAS-domain containing protein [Rubritepida sp.]|nr:PAS-domain containing protein [Rubritepida sp.]
MNRGFLQVDSTLLGLPVLLAPFLREGRLDVAGASEVLRELNNQNFAFRDLLIVGPEGTPLATALAVSRRRPLPLPFGPAYAEIGLPGDGPRIGGPVRNARTGEWSLFFVRALDVPGLGRVHAVAELQVAVLGGLLGAGGELPGLRAALELRDGRLLAALPPDEPRLGTAVPRAPASDVFAAARTTLYPSLSVMVTLDRAVALRAWRDERDRAIRLSAAFAVLVVALGAALLLALRQRGRMEEERQRWRAMLESALDSMNDGFVMFDADDRLVICNRRYREIYALSAPFIREGAHFDDIIRGGIANGQYPQFAGNTEGFLAELHERRRNHGAPIERLLPDGRWILITERPTPDGGTVGIRTDITALKRAMQEAEAAAEAKSMFLARMSHELRTPLNAILGFAQLLISDRNLTAAQYEQLRLLHEAGAHLRELVNGLLDLAKINAGRLEIAAEPVALEPLLQGCIGFLSPEARRKGIALTLARGEGLPPAVAGDATRLRQMILNLLSNAVKFTPGGGAVVLRVEAMPAGLRIAVSDSGPGVPLEKRHLLFNDFTQLGGLADPESPGTGLGLAITARLAALMGGRIGVESEPGRGATFWLELPLPPARLPAALPSGEGGLMPALRLLVADDIAPNRLLMRAMLTAAGHDVTLASDGAEALALLQREPFDAALLDVRMPGMDGLEATRRIRAMPPPLSRLPIIAVTASALPEEVAECEAAGMDAHLAKPVDRQAMFALLRRLVPVAPPVEGPLAELGAAAGPVLREFLEELDGVAAALALPEAQAGGEALRGLLHRALGAAATLRAPALGRAIEEAQASLRAGAAPAAIATAAAGAIAAELPVLRAALAHMAPAAA